MLKQTLIAGVLVVSLSGCQWLQKIDPFPEVESIAKYCELYNYELNLATSLAPKMSREQLEIQQKAIEVVDPICTQDTPPNNQDLLLQVINNVEIMVGLRERIED